MEEFGRLLVMVLGTIAVGHVQPREHAPMKVDFALQQAIAFVLRLLPAETFKTSLLLLAIFASCKHPS